MSQGKLDEQQKKNLQEARRKTKEERDEALEVVRRNSQFTNAKFWKRLDYDFLEEVEKAVQQARKELKQKRIEELENKLSELRNE